MPRKSTVEGFLKKELGLKKMNGNIFKNTKGWREQKKLIK